MPLPRSCPEGRREDIGSETSVSPEKFSFETSELAEGTPQKVTGSRS